MPIKFPSQEKTECPFCGLVWQEHTIKELQGCMAIMHMQWPDPDEGLEVGPCPVCNKLPAEHTEDDRTACLAKWRKRERGSTGLKGLFTFIESRVEPHGQKQETDPKIAELRAKWMKAFCPCGKALVDHTMEELMTCAPRNQGR